MPRALNSCRAARRDERLLDDSAFVTNAVRLYHLLKLASPNFLAVRHL